MNKLDFSTPENREKALADFTSLLTHPGWLLVEDIVNANIEFIKEQIVSGGEGETVETITRLRDKLKIHKDVVGTPRMMIEKLKPSDGTEAYNDDPYV